MNQKLIRKCFLKVQNDSEGKAFSSELFKCFKIVLQSTLITLIPIKIIVHPVCFDACKNKLILSGQFLNSLRVTVSLIFRHKSEVEGGKDFTPECQFNLTSLIIQPLVHACQGHLAWPLFALPNIHIC